TRRAHPGGSMRSAAPLWLLLLPALAAGAADHPRFALAVSSSDGRAGRAKLWFPAEDVRRLSSALSEVGGFAGDHLRTLRDPSLGAMRAELDALVSSARASIARGEVPLVLFYYSGHAAADGLELGLEVLPYAELRDRLSSLSGGVSVVVLDACHSGALTQVKGARPADLDFEVPARPGSDGMAILTSSSASEVAQESAELRGSFFTHHFTLGLRGAADGDGDGRITLAEAYRYAYHRTLSATSSSGVVPQHPTYAIRLAGKGEVVLAELNRSGSALVLGAGTGRTYLVSRDSTQEVVAEIASAEWPLKVALPAGKYRVERLLPAPRLSGPLELVQGQTVALQDAALKPVVAAASLPKGGAWEGAPRTYLSVEGWLASPILRNFGPAYGGGVGARHDVESLPLSVFGSATYSVKDVDDGGFTYQYRALTAGAGAALQLRLGGVGALLGLQAGLSWASQRLLNGERADGLMLQGGPGVSVLTPLLAPRVWLRTTAQANAHVFVLNGERVVRGSLQLQAAVEIGL
ncbi:MAG TPA: caspase family protein, partial [Myxococcales bacterium]|nr:caspase family protein [Myxococcales bacterium]